MYVTLWSFNVKPGKEREFEVAYGPKGRWVEFFRRGKGHYSTDLLRDGTTYITIDRWDSEAAYGGFREQFIEEYNALDTQFQELTVVEETHLGAFTVTE